MKGISKLAMVVVVGVVLLGMAVLTPKGNVVAYDVNATSDAQIVVSINNQTIVDVTPQGMNWGAQDPGTVVTQYTDTENGVVLSQIEIENLGSTDITYVWLNVTQPASNPFGSGDINLYDPANWLAVKNASYTTFWFVDRVEFNSSVDYIYLNKPTNTVSFGKIRDANREYFWVINLTGSYVYCNGTTGVTADLVVGVNAHNVTNTGTIDLVNGPYTMKTIAASGDPNWGIIDGLAIGEDGTPYCIAVYYDCSKFRLYRWNADAPGASACTAFGTDGLTLNGGSPIYPGGAIVADVQLHIPYGVPDGNLPTGYMYVIASAA
ncbi:MAG: hypothetical protein GXN99_01730 [Candidatus Nanohaloarchaeota archaeon]|nr:hypothetical protein [Candidatus Nanohaloarchaeota archaeon]